MDVVIDVLPFVDPREFLECQVEPLHVAHQSGFHPEDHRVSRLHSVSQLHFAAERVPVLALQFVV